MLKGEKVQLSPLPNIVKKRQQNVKIEKLNKSKEKKAYKSYPKTMMRTSLVNTRSVGLEINGILKYSPNLGENSLFQLIIPYADASSDTDASSVGSLAGVNYILIDANPPSLGL